MKELVLRKVSECNRCSLKDVKELERVQGSGFSSALLAKVRIQYSLTGAVWQ